MKNTTKEPKLVFFFTSLAKRKILFTVHFTLWDSSRYTKVLFCLNMRYYKIQLSFSDLNNLLWQILNLHNAVTLQPLRRYSVKMQLHTGTLDDANTMHLPQVSHLYYVVFKTSGIKPARPGLFWNLTTKFSSEAPNHSNAATMFPPRTWYSATVWGAANLKQFALQTLCRLQNH